MSELTGWRRGDSPEALLTREWLVTNALGGYASGTIGGVATRRYHGLLIAALPSPLGRYLMLNHLDERVSVDGNTTALTGWEPSGGELDLPASTSLDEFRLEDGLPVWRFDIGGGKLIRRLFMPHLQNSVWISWELVEGDEADLALRPAMHFRPHEHDVTTPPIGYHAEVEGERMEVRGPGGVPPLRVATEADGFGFEPKSEVLPEMLYRVEQSRGYPCTGVLWSPGTMRVRLRHGVPATLVCTTESWENAGAMTAEAARIAEQERRTTLLDLAGAANGSSHVASLVLAADQFVIVPKTRPADEVRAEATGEEPRTVIAGYHWFTDWGRDTMISLEGLTLATGRHHEAGSILRTFAAHVRDGLIPNMFPEGENEGLYHTADATLWFFHALHRYVEQTGDRRNSAHLLPVLDDIVQHHLDGTRFGIGVDPRDGLLRQGAEGYQLTWMDAKVDGWVVTPRRGKAVEINALFYNALKLLEGWTRDAGEGARADELRDHSERLRESFNRRFWYDEGGYLFDVVDGEDSGDDPSLRPNQILSVSLDYPVLDPSRWGDVLEAVRRELLTPVGLRSLSRGDREYKRNYHGDLRARDAAYHQGTVWSWLIGPFIDAWLKVHPQRRAEARDMLRGLEAHLADAGVGSVSEIFDAEEPFTPRGCIAQAWGVAELLRSVRKLE